MNRNMIVLPDRGDNRKPSENEVKRAARLELSSRYPHGAERSDLEFEAETGAVIYRLHYSDKPRPRPPGWHLVHAHVRVRVRRREVALCLHDLPRGSVPCGCYLHNYVGDHYRLDDVAAEPRFTAAVASVRRYTIDAMIRVLTAAGYHVIPPPPPPAIAVRRRRWS